MNTLLNATHLQDESNQLKSHSKFTLLYKGSTEFNMLSKKIQHLTVQDKLEMEKMRRFHIKISKIFLTPIGDIIKPFLHFTIGGDFLLNVYNTKEGETLKIPSGKRGYVDLTEIMEMGKERKQFDKIIELEIRMSYSMISKEKIMVEIWEYNTIWMNQIISYLTLPIIDLVDGSCNFGDYFTRKENGDKIPYGYLEFVCEFEEIFDYVLTFSDWFCSSIKAEEKKKIKKTKIEIEITDKLSKPLSQRTISESSSTFSWSKFESGIIYRGTKKQLENEDICIYLIDSSSIFSSVLDKKVASLHQILSNQKIRAEFTLAGHPLTVQGSVLCEDLPKYTQKDLEICLISTKKYLVIKILRIERIKVLDENKGIVDSYVEVEYDGKLQRTKTVKENNNPSFNEILFFEVSEKQLKNEIGFNLIIENDDGSCDHTANCFLTLDKILSGNPTKSEEVYYAEDLKKEVSYVSNKFSMQGVLESLFENDEQCFDSQSKKTVLHFDAWFLGDVDKEKISHQTRKEAKDESAEIKTLEKIFRANVSLAFEKYSSYPFSERNFFDLRGKDSYLSEHILSYFIAPIVLTEQQRGTLQTLPSIAHFVRCYPMSYVDNILSSDYMIKNRKGGVLCHSILMANLMAGLMQDKGGSEGLGSVFVCIGALKESHLKHTWVMVIKNSTVCFYDPIVASNTTLKGRVNDVTRLNSYLGNSPEETNSEKSNKNIRGIIKGYGKEKGEMEKVILKCQNETIIEYDDQEDFDENNTISNNTMSILNKSRTAEEVKQKIINNKLVDQKIIKKPSTDSSSQHFISSEKDSIELDIEEEKNLKKIPNEFDDETPLNIPYETVDVIFNDKNIFANSQHHSPDKIYYDLYDKTKWIAFYDRPVQRENSSWNYNFGPSYSKKIISSMTTKLQREVKVEIAVSRKNLNMYTKFKKMKEQIVLQLENYLDILEKRALGVYEQGEFEEALEEFSSRVKEYMPQFFKMEMNDLFFNSFDLVSIRKDVREKLEGIWNDRRKKIIFGSSAKVYGYINHTISVRVAVAKFYKIPLEDVKSEREEMEYEEKEELLESKEEE